MLAVGLSRSGCGTGRAEQRGRARLLGDADAQGSKASVSLKKSATWTEETLMYLYATCHCLVLAVIAFLEAQRILGAFSVNNDAHSIMCIFGQIAAFHMGKDKHSGHWLTVFKSIMLEIRVFLKSMAPCTPNLPLAILLMSFSPFLVSWLN